LLFPPRRVAFINSPPHRTISPFVRSPLIETGFQLPTQQDQDDLFGSDSSYIPLASQPSFSSVSCEQSSASSAASNPDHWQASEDWPASSACSQSPSDIGELATRSPHQQASEDLEQQGSGLGKRRIKRLQSQKAWDDFEHPFLGGKEQDATGCYLTCSRCNSRQKMVGLSTLRFLEHQQRHCPSLLSAGASQARHLECFKGWRLQEKQQATSSMPPLALPMLPDPPEPPKCCDGVCPEKVVGISSTAIQPFADSFNQACASRGIHREVVLAVEIMTLFQRFDNSEQGSAVVTVGGRTSLKCVGSCHGEVFSKRQLRSDALATYYDRNGPSFITCKNCLMVSYVRARDDLLNCRDSSEFARDVGGIGDVVADELGGRGGSRVSLSVRSGY
jgi:hypothetical protein